MMKYLFLVLLLTTGAKSCKESKQNTNTKQMSVETKSIHLHDIWALTAIDGNDIDKASFPLGVPTIELYVEDLKVNGFTGCNNYFGEIEKLSDETLTFGPIAATKKFCMDVDEKAFLSRLNQIISYELDNTKLIFYTSEDLSLSFKKVD